jgi:hypothetical protein
MRRIAGSLIAALGLLATTASARAEIGDHTGGTGAGGVVVGGTPIAIAVMAPSGTLATYARRGSGSGPTWTCAYYGLENGSSSGISVNIDFSSGPVDPVRGEGYGFVCRDDRLDVVHSWFGVYDPADPFSGLLAAERAAELALERLELEPPVLRFSPARDHVVGLPSWMWVEMPWVPSAASAGVTGVTSTVTATPRSVTWTMGDGSTQVCDGPGTPYDAARAPEAQTGTCTHLYVWPSTDQPGGVYSVSAVVTFDVTWEATTGAGGELGSVTRSSTVPLRVVEVQAVID